MLLGEDQDIVGQLAQQGIGEVLRRFMVVRAQATQRLLARGLGSVKEFFEDPVFDSVPLRPAHFKIEAHRPPRRFFEQTSNIHRMCEPKN